MDDDNFVTDFHAQRFFKSNYFQDSSILRYVTKLILCTEPHSNSLSPAFDSSV